MSEEKTIEQDVRDLMNATAKKSFVAGYEPTDAEVLGIIVAHVLKWDGVAIAKAAYNAFEDANFHTLNTEFAALLRKHKIEVEN